MLETRREGIENTGNTIGVMRSVQTLQRTLLIVAPLGSISECLVNAVEREFPGVSVEQFAEVEGIFGKLEHPASLILADAAMLPDIDACAAEISRRHPTAVVALMFDDSWHTKDLLADVLPSRTIRGVLPMNLKLDLWLSVVRLMLRGGEYFPPWLFQIGRGTLPTPLLDPSGHAEHDANAAGAATPAGLSDLTGREVQILEMVSRGYQNKVIAARFKLSEHTVKVHLHHIIKKLGAHNRTSAAAIFLGSTSTVARPGFRAS
jgi:DNA-binding NarL/FixJ family response regulator